MELKEYLAQQHTVDWGDPFGERTVYIKTPMRFEDFGEEEKAMLLTTNYIRDHITLTVHQGDYAREYRLEAAFQVSNAEPKFTMSAVVQTIDPSVDSERIQDTEEKLVDALIDKVKTYYEVQKHKEETNVKIQLGCYVDYIGVDMKKLMKKNKEMINMGSMGISWRDTFSKEENKMSGLIYCDEICEYLGIQKRTPDNKPKWIEGLPAVDKVETYNNRVVKVTFVDGTFTKAVCSKNDNFDLDMGITICAMKRLLGTNSENATREYNRFISHVHSVMEKNTLKELAEEAQKAKEKQKQRKAELKRAAKKLKSREEQIDIQKQAILRAQKETFSQFEGGAPI